MIRARFRLTLPEEVWVAAVSRSFPRATLRLLTGVPRGDRALELGEVRAGNATQVAEAIRDHPDIVAYETVYAGEDRVIAGYEAIEQGLYEFLWSSSFPPEFPVVVENGAMEFELTATREGLETFGATLEEGDRPYELLSVVHTGGEAGEGLLTERQRECLTVAHRRGYFAVPRDSTLAELADVLGVDKSTASETIRRATARVVDQFLARRD